MSTSLLSPNTGNLTVAKGIVSFQKDFTGDFRDIGEVKEFEVTMNIEQLEHFTQRGGVKEKDLTVVLSRGGEARMIMEEWTPDNLALMFMGTVNELAVGGPSLEIMSEDATEGVLKFVGTNDVGVNYTVILDRVRFIPSGSINMISEEWAPLEITGEILKSQTTNSFGTAQMTNLNDES